MAGAVGSYQVSRYRGRDAGSIRGAPGDVGPTIPELMDAQAPAAAVHPLLQQSHGPLSDWSGAALGYRILLLLPEHYR